MQRDDTAMGGNDDPGHDLGGKDDGTITLVGLGDWLDHPEIILIPDHGFGDADTVPGKVRRNQSADLSAPHGSEGGQQDSGQELRPVLDMIEQEFDFIVAWGVQEGLRAGRDGNIEGMPSAVGDCTVKQAYNIFDVFMAAFGIETVHPSLHLSLRKMRDELGLNRHDPLLQVDLISSDRGGRQCLLLDINVFADRIVDSDIVAVILLGDRPLRSKPLAFLLSFPGRILHGEGFIIFLPSFVVSGEDLASPGAGGQFLCSCHKNLL